ncbi:MAG: DUF4340 domain-containing protein [Magnetococcales bacterium]|nr:DUF4340 domain-containing protein [Magnetococcales bacterium]
MRKGWMGNLMLLLALAGAAGFLWWDNERQQAEQKSDEKLRALSTLNKTEIDTIQLTGANGIETTLTRQDNRWRITKPQPLITDSSAASNLLDPLDRSYERLVTKNPEHPADFGLATPQYVLTFHAKKGRRTTFQVGGQSPARKQRYLRLGTDGPVVLISQETIVPWMKSIADLRNKSLAPGVREEQLSHIELKRATTPLILSRDKDQPWHLKQPLQDLADAPRLVAWIQTLATTKGSGFVKAIPPSQPDWTLLLEGDNDQQWQIPIWRNKGQILAQRGDEPDALILAGYIASDLDKPATELVRLRPLAGEGRPDALGITRNGQTKRAKRLKESWPEPIWSAVEEVLTRNAWQGLEVDQANDTAPLFTILATVGEKEQRFPLWKDKENLLIAPPNRPVRLRLTALQTQSLEEAVKEMFGEKEKPKKPQEVNHKDGNDS